MDYIKGVFLKEKQGQYGRYFILSFNEEGANNIKALKSNTDGFRTLIASPRKDDPNKFSIKEFVPKNTDNKDIPF
jgi:hypothetical protein